jgi:hypothetical protein
VCVDPLRHLKAVAALRQRLRLDPAHVAVELAIAALDEGHIAEALGRNAGDDCALALQQGIRRPP